MTRSKIVVPITLALWVSVATASEEDSPTNKIDFGNSYVQGQSIKSGAVYLMNRKKNEIQSMLKKRTSYRSDILDEYPEFRDSSAKDSDSNHR